MQGQVQGQVHRRVRAVVLALAGVVLLTTGAVGAPAQGWEPPSGAVFNWPRPWGTGEQRQRIVRAVERTVDHTRPTRRDPHPVILVSSYLMDRRESAVALIEACRRGVSVRVVLDDAVDSAASRRMVAALNADDVRDEDGDGVADRPARSGPCGSPLPGARRGTDADRAHRGSWSRARLLRSVEAPTDEPVTWGGDRSYVTQCEGSCRGAGGNTHSKFYVFSSSGSADHVVMVSSSNLNAGGVLNGWNDLWSMVERPVSYATYVAIHREMTQDSRADDGLVELVDGRYTSRFYPMRRATRETDPVLADLDRIRCRGADGPTRVDVSMFGWKGERGLYLAEKVFGLQRHGCRVRVIFGAPSRRMSQELRRLGRRHDVPVWNSRWDFDGDGHKEVRAHTKYVLVRGGYADDRDARLVMTGSANWVDGGLTRGDEVTLTIDSARAHRQYLAHWELVRRHSVRVAG